MEKQVFDEFLNRRQMLADTYSFISHRLRSDNSQKIHLGEGAPLICRYCGKCEHQTKFKNESHVIPIFIGNKTLIDKLECDACNKKFSIYLEDGFSKYTLPYRAFSGIHARGGMPKHKDKNISARVGKDNVLDIQALTEDKSFYKQEGDSIICSATRQPYYPSSIYKSFVKMALALMPEADFKRCSYLLNYINREDYLFIFNNVILVETVIQGPVDPNSIDYLLGRAKQIFENEYFGYVLAIRFGNYQYQVALPSDKDMSDGKVKSFVIAPPFISELHMSRYGIPSQENLELSGNYIIKGDTCELAMKIVSEIVEHNV